MHLGRRAAREAEGNPVKPQLTNLRDASETFVVRLRDPLLKALFGLGGTRPREVKQMLAEKDTWPWLHSFGRVMMDGGNGRPLPPPEKKKKKKRPPGDAARQVLYFMA